MPRITTQYTTTQVARLLSCRGGSDAALLNGITDLDVDVSADICVDHGVTSYIAASGTGHSRARIVCGLWLCVCAHCVALAEHSCRHCVCPGLCLRCPQLPHARVVSTPGFIHTVVYTHTQHPA